MQDWRVVRIENGLVSQEYWDCQTLGEFANKYGLSGPDFISTQHPHARVGNRYMGGTSFALPVPLPPTSRDVHDERDRRIALGRTFTIGGMQIAVRGAQIDRENLIALSTMATSIALAGQGASMMQYRDEANVIHSLSWLEMSQLGALSMQYVSACYASAWALKDAAGGIPHNYASDDNWPGVS